MLPDFDRARQQLEGRHYSSVAPVKVEPIERSILPPKSALKSEADMQAQITRLQHETNKMRAETTQLYRRKNLIESINKRRNSWLAECDNNINSHKRILSGASAPNSVGDKLSGLKKQRQSRTISHNQVMLNHKNDLRARIERLATDSLKTIIEMPEERFLSDRTSGVTLAVMDSQKAKLVQEIKHRLDSTEQAYAKDMKALQPKQPPKLPPKPPSGPSTAPISRKITEALSRTGRHHHRH